MCHMTNFSVLPLVFLLAWTVQDNPLFPPPKAGPKRISVSTAASLTHLKPGARASLWLDVVPNPGIHVYAPGAKGYQALELKMSPAAGISAGKVTYPPSEILFFEPLGERVPVFQKPFRIEQAISLSKQWTSSTMTVNGVVTYQACDDKVCYAPGTIPVSWTLTVD